MGARLTSANQKWQEISPDEDDGIDLQLEFTDDDGNGTGRYLYLQLKAGPCHLRRRADRREAPLRGYDDRMGKQRALFEELDGERNSSETRAFPDVHWMEISSVLQQQLAAGRQPQWRW